MKWRVLRQDDNGNVVVLVEVDSEDEAKAIAAAFEARAHKQIYEVELVGESKLDLAGSPK